MRDVITTRGFSEFAPWKCRAQLFQNERRSTHAGQVLTGRSVFDPHTDLSASGTVVPVQAQIKGTVQAATAGPREDAGVSDGL